MTRVDLTRTSVTVLSFARQYNSIPRIFLLSAPKEVFTSKILPVVLYGCETWSLTLREECRLRVFENLILRRIFGSKRDANEEWRRVHNEELRSLYRSPNVISNVIIQSKHFYLEIYKRTILPIVCIWMGSIVSHIKG